MSEIESVHEYIEKKKEKYEALLNYLENSDLMDSYFQELQEIIDDEIFEKNKEELKNFLLLISSIADNHCRCENFFNKIKNILKMLKETIKKSFTNEEIFRIYKSNNIILLFLLENSIIKLDYNIFNELILEKGKYCHFFYPEIKEFIERENIKDYEPDILLYDDNILYNFDIKRKEGQNDSYICSLIRQDSVEEFVTYVNRTNYYLSNKIDFSIFETNSFLIENHPTLIEYAAFFGSIQIFQYLKYNNVQLKSSLWLFAIHSNNPELIHLLESEEIEPPNCHYESCFIESIKCHHNDIASYIENKYLYKNIINEVTITSQILYFHNYLYLPTEINIKRDFYNLCANYFYEIVKFFNEENEEIIKERIIEKK